MKRFIVYFLLTIFFSGTSLLAQFKAEVSGRITDAETKESMAGVNVLIKGKQIGSVSDARGYFYLSAGVELPFTLILEKRL